MRISIPTLAIATSLVISPAPALAQCNTFCGVGAFGTGGTSSDGKAQGWHLIRPGSLEGFTISNVGNSDAGRTAVYLNGELYGYIEGTIRDDICRGNSEGLRFGEYTGFEPDCL
jgi:hypothetical protein